MERWIDQNELGVRIGMVVPAYFSAKPSDDLVRHLLYMTLADCHHYLPLEHIVVVVDGDARTARLAEELRQHLAGRHGRTFRLMPLAENHGKLWAMQEGIKALLSERPDIEYIAIRDGDGDHVASDLPRLARAARFLAEAYAGTRLIIIGARRSRHRPMGWLRGELEMLLDRITLDALVYALALQGRALNLRHCLGEGVPDLSSGYKMYGREAAELLFRDAQPRYEGLTPYDYWHYGPETMTIVEAVLQDTVLAELPRLTWDGQPATSFGEFRLVSLYGELLAWVFCRLAISPVVAAQMYDNHVPSLALRTTAQGQEMLTTLRAFVLEKLCRQRGEAASSIPEPKPMLPFL
ncbi:MAG: glycosyltransferase [Chloroflexi bacterium]|nr:glycosyltransferase [Chloroflexota bacterium]